MLSMASSSYTLADVLGIPTVLEMHEVGPWHSFIWVDGPELNDLIREHFSVAWLVDIEVWPDFGKTR